MPHPLERIGRYEVLGELGRGGMAVIFLARQPELDRRVALKRLELLRGPDHDLAGRFLREAKVAGSFAHPNIVTVFDYFEHEGQLYIAMEYAERGSLRAYVERGLTPAQMYGALEGVLQGLAHAAARGVVHRDMKPENVLVTAGGAVKIADFGIAKAIANVTEVSRLTATGMALGTPHYMAPEQALAAPVGPYTDLYAVGVMAYEMVTGQPPFEAASAPMAIMLRHINEAPPPLPPSVDPRLAAWILRLLEKRPEDRPASADEAWEQLEEIAVDELGYYWHRSAALLATGEIGALRTPTPQEPVIEMATEPAVEPTNGHARDRAPARVEPEPVAASVVVPQPGPAVELEPIALAEPRDAPAETVAPRGPSPEPATRETLARRRRAPLAGGAIAAVAAIAAASLAYAAAPGRVTRSPLPLTATAQGDDLAARMPAGWTSTRAEGDPVPGLALRDAIELRPPTAGDDVVALGWTDTADAGLLPGGALDALGDPKPVRVKLGDAEAFGYGPVEADDGRFTVYAVPTSKGVATVACRGGESGDVARSCDGIARSLVVSGAEPFGLPPRAPFAHDVDVVSQRLSRDEQAAERELASARLPASQAAALRRLSAAYAAAAESLAQVAVAPFESGPTRGLIEHVRRLEREARALADAAAGGHEKRYRDRRAAFRRLRADLPARIEALAAIGRENP